MAKTSAEGTWNLVIDTPIGKQRATLTLSAQNGVLRGVACTARACQ